MIQGPSPQETHPLPPKKELEHVDQSDSALALTGDFFTETQLATLHQLGIEEAGEGDLRVFYHVSRRTGLDPFARQIYLIGRPERAQVDGRWQTIGTKWTIQTGIDGFRLVARRAADRHHETLEYEDTQWCGADGIWTDVWTLVTAPAAARVTVLRNGKRFSAVALYREYAQTKANGEPNSMWAKMPANQLEKCAEAKALRKAYPHDLSGLYTDDEMAQADNDGRIVSDPAATVEGDVITVEQIQEQARADGGPVDNKPITAQQSTRIGELLVAAGINDRAGAVGYLNDHLDREVRARKDLTHSDAERIIASLEAEARLRQVPDEDVKVDVKGPVESEDVPLADPNDGSDPWVEGDKS